MKWEAEWIWRSRQVQVNDFSYFRKQFLMDEELESAQLYVSCHHYAQVYINGTKLGGYVSPAPTYPEKRKLYNAYEVSGLLQKGENCITADAHYLGGSCQNSVNGLPGFRLELHWTDASGRKQKLKTDTSWLTLTDMPHQIGAPYQQNRRISAVESYDARKWNPAWRHAGGDFSNISAPAQLALIGSEDWPMQLQTIPEGKIDEELSLVTVAAPQNAENGEAVQIFDAGRVVSGWPKIRLKGYEGITIRMRYSENLNEHGRVGHNVANENAEYYYDEYTMRGEEIEEWQPDFSYKAFRFVEITGYPEVIEANEGVTVCAACTAIDYIGSFRCSDEFLNSLYTAAIRTQKNNALGQFVDCPHREQAQYLADTDLQAELLIYNFNALAMLEKTLSDFADAQLADGTFPFVAPTTYEHPDFNIQIPEWDLHFATLLWKLYETSENVELLAAYYEPMIRMVNYFITIIDTTTGLVPLDKGWHISDWPYPSVEHEGQFLTVQQIKLLQAMRISARVAGLLGKSADQETFEQEAQRLLININKHLYVPDMGAYKDSIDSTAAHQGVTAIALFADAVPQEERERALNFVKNKPWECRTVLSLPLLRMLFENGCEAEAFAIINRREYPGWGHMIEQGSLTLWEGWEDIESHSHAWNGYPVRLLQEYVVGIKSAAPGFKKAVIRPYLPETLHFAEATVWTAQGNLYARWEKAEGGRVVVTTNIPAGITARLELSVGGKKYGIELREGVSETVL